MKNVKQISNHWMPFTANKEFKSAPRITTKAEGVYYTNQQGEKILDGCSGLFNVPLGHGRTEIADVVHQQIETMDFAPHFNVGHPWAEEAAKGLTDILPPKLNRLFFVNSGSEAIDSAIKMSLAYWCAKKQATKTILVSRERAYHGVNLGGVALAGLQNNRRFFQAIAPLTYHMRHTRLEENTFSRAIPLTGGKDLAQDLQRAVDLYGADHIAACFVEPIAGSTGCLVPPVGYLERLEEIARENDILLVSDETITAFARTGKWFGCQSFDFEPDMITTAKAITNGLIPMGAIACKQDIYDTVVDSKDKDMIELFHGYTTSAHPVACAACIKTIEIMQKEKVDQKVQDMSQYFEDKLFELEEIPVISDLRNYGLMAGIELKPKDKPFLRGNEAYQKAFWQGLHIKATVDNLILAPAYIMAKEQIDEMFGILKDVLSEMKVSA